MFFPAPQTKGLMHVKWIRAGVALEKSPTLLVALRRSGMTSSNLFPGFHYTCGQTWYSTKPGSELSDGPSCSTTGSDLKKKKLKINKKTTHYAPFISGISPTPRRCVIVLQITDSVFISPALFSNRLESQLMSCVGA